MPSIKRWRTFSCFTFDLIVAHDGQAMNGVEYSGHLPQNDTTKDVVYKFYIKEKADATYDAKNVITITVKAKNTAEPTITGINRTEIVLEPDSPSRYVTLTFEGNNLSDETVKAVTKKDGVVTDEIKWNYLEIVGFMASTTMPAAPDDKDIVYTTTFSTANGSSQTVKITVKAKPGAASTEKENREKENKAFESIIQKDGPYIEDANLSKATSLIPQAVKSS